MNVSILKHGGIYFERKTCMDYVGISDFVSGDPVSDQSFLLRSTIIDLETMRTPYEPSSRGYMALTTAISILRQMQVVYEMDKPKLRLIKECND
jgi:hypothetical protein